MLCEKMRPTEFADLVQPDSIVRALERMAKSGEPSNMLFYGLPGLGKTSAARILLRCTENGVTFNGSLDNGVDLIRSIRAASKNAGIGEGMRVFFIDEADYLTPNAQGGLRATIEESISTSRYLLACNEIKKFHPALKSRCMPICFDIPAGSATATIARLLPRYHGKLKQAGFDVNRSRLRELLHVYYPDLRRLANVIEFGAGGEASRE